MRLPRVFTLLSVTIVAAGVAGVAFHAVGLPSQPAFVPPALMLITALFDVASATLLTVIFARTRERALTVLVLMFLTLTVLNVASLLTLPQPDAPSLILPGNGAAPYLTLVMLAIVPLATIWYAVERRRQIVLTPNDVRRVVRLGFPSAGMAALVGTALLIAASSQLPHLVTGAERFGFRRSPLSLADIALTLVAVVILHRTMIAETVVRRIDYAVALTLLASGSALAIIVAGDHRFGVSATLSRLLLLSDGTFVFGAAIRSLVDLLEEGLRIEADVLRAEANAFQQNVAVEASLVKSRFVAMVSHELRTPLSGIAGMAELLERTELNQRQMTFTHVIRSSADNLLRIVNDLLDFSRVESGTIELEERPLDLAMTVEETVALFREQARLRGVQMYAYIDPDVPRSIVGDETRIKQVLQNLLNNAVRFTSAGSIRVEVARVCTTNGQDFLRFSVTDTGTGIDAGARERIFRPFMQEDASTSRRFGGTGLGLTIARSLVEMMGGTIGVESTPGIGSTFTFFVPCKSVGPSLTDPLLRDITVLIVEREPEVRNLLQRYVAGWEMRSAAAASLPPDPSPYELILVGPGVPPDDVERIGRAKRERAALAAASVVLIRDGAVETAAVPGIDALVAGPLRQSSLFDVIVRVRSSGFVERAPSTTRAVASAHRRGERVLLADDNDINQQLLLAQLEVLGLHAEVVGDGLAAVTAARARPYDLIFMDCQMPEMDGFEATRAIRSEQGPSQHATIVAVTANVLPGYREVCLASGMSDYLGKPVLLDALTAIVDRWLPLDGGASRAPFPRDRNAGPRERLLAIFKNDANEVDALLARSHDAIAVGLANLGAMIDAGDARGTARLAHKLKGIAVEIGRDDLSSDLHEIEIAAGQCVWNQARIMHGRLQAAFAK